MAANTGVAEKTGELRGELRILLEKMSQIMVLCSEEFNPKYRTLHHLALQKLGNAR